MSELVNHNYKSIWLQENLGFVKATNLGIKAGKSEYVILQNNDTEVTDGWIDRLMKPILAGDFVAAGPMTNTDGSWQGWKNVKNTVITDLPDLTNMSADEASKILFEKYKYSARDVKMVAFYCTLFKRSVFDEIGLLDEVFKVGFGDDDDFCMRIKNAGHLIAFVPSAYILHHHRTTFKSVFREEKVKEMQDINLEIFRKKHKLI